MALYKHTHRFVSNLIIIGISLIFFVAMAVLPFIKIDSQNIPIWYVLAVFVGEFALLVIHRVVVEYCLSLFNKHVAIK